MTPEDGGDALLRNMRSFADYTVLYPRSGNIQVSEGIIQSIVRVEQKAEQPTTTSPTSGNRSVGILRSRTQATEFVCFCFVSRRLYGVHSAS
jgi:hypothetical protein